MIYTQSWFLILFLITNVIESWTISNRVISTTTTRKSMHDDDDDDTNQRRYMHTRRFIFSSSLLPLASSLSCSQENHHHHDHHDDHDDSQQQEQQSANIEKAWKYITKPLLRVGSQGITLKHGNSLRELLLAHTLVKVKVNSSSLGSFQQVFLLLKQQVESAAAAAASGTESSSSSFVIQDIELITMKPLTNTLLIGLPGSLQRIYKGEYPPPPFVPTNVPITNPIHP